MKDNSRNLESWWLAHPKGGRPPYYTDPDVLWQDCCEYFEFTKTRTIDKVEYHGKDALRCLVPTNVPFTLTGLCIFIGMTLDTWAQYRKKEEFSAVCTRVQEIIYSQKFNGAAVGQYNANIIARDLGLADKKTVDLDVRGKVADVFPDESELNADSSDSSSS